VAAMLPAKKQRYASTITAMNPDEKTVTLKDGHKIQYNKLLTTIPLGMYMYVFVYVELLTIHFKHMYTPYLHVS
jgi:protoporphyrinogen oxidase